MELLFLMFLIGMAVFSAIDLIRFIQPAGEMKRGIKVGSEMLSKDMASILRGLSTGILRTHRHAFIEKRDQVVLIQPINSIHRTYLGYLYVGVVDLSVKEPRIEYRISYSTSLWLIILVGTLLSMVFNGSRTEAIRAIFVLLLMVPVLYIAHAVAKRIVREYITKNLQKF